MNLDSPVPFRGFLLEARSSSSDESSIIGSFNLPKPVMDSKLLNCTGGYHVNYMLHNGYICENDLYFLFILRSQNAVTHAINSPKLNESFLWFPPANYSGQIIFKYILNEINTVQSLFTNLILKSLKFSMKFRATVVKQFNTFWVGIESLPIVSH